MSDDHDGRILVAGSAPFDAVLHDLGVGDRHDRVGGLRLLGHDRLFFGAKPHYLKTGYPDLFPAPTWDLGFGTDYPWDEQSRCEWAKAMGDFLEGLHNHEGVSDWLLRTDDSHVVGFWVAGKAVLNSHTDGPVDAFRELFAYEVMGVFDTAGLDIEYRDLGDSHPIAVRQS